MNLPDQLGIGAKITTSLTGGGNSVVGNVTISFCVAVLAGVMIAGFFLWAGAPSWLALVAFFGMAVFFLVYLLVTLQHAAKHPDASVTSEEYYARVVASRMSARDPEIMIDVRPASAPVAIAKTSEPPADE